LTRLEEIARALGNPKVYPEPTARVDVSQTQMSLVFLTDKFVYKIKKPVNLGYLDYSTLQQRKFFCEQEVRLNSRFGGDVYLGVIPVNADGAVISLNGKGEIIEYAVKMRRLPAERMMDALLAQNRVTPAMMTQVAAKVKDFHQIAATSPEIGKFGSIETVTFNTEENFSQTQPYLGEVLPPAQYERIALYTREFIKRNATLFQKRVAEGKIRDCHGDLHSQHICFTDEGIRIYDCIEFNDRFRYVDVAAEVAFLAMDLDRWGRPELSRQFVADYIQKSGDKEIKTLLNFYKCYFAYVRAKVNCFKMGAPLVTPAEKEKSRQDARKYFNLAESYIK